jgi:hypothetical protein
MEASNFRPVFQTGELIAGSVGEQLLLSRYRTQAGALG